MKASNRVDIPNANRPNIIGHFRPNLKKRIKLDTLQIKRNEYLSDASPNTGVAANTPKA